MPKPSSPPNTPTPMVRIGFTGTQNGMTKKQQREVRSLLKQFKEEAGPRRPIEFHHGDCIGSDEQAHRIAMSLRYSIHIHPPDKDGKRACMKGMTLHPPRPYLKRNLDIVRAAQVLIATPRSTVEEWRGSGTWATIRYGRKAGIPVHIVEP